MTKLESINTNLNDLVYILNKTSTVGQAKKLQPKYKGPYPIQIINNNKTYGLQVKNKIITYHHNLLKPYFSDDQD